MDTASQERRTRQVRRLSLAAAMLTLLSGGAALVVWAIDLAATGNTTAKLLALNAPPAPGFLLLGIGIILLYTNAPSPMVAIAAGRACALLVLVPAVLLLGKYWLPAEFGLQSFIFSAGDLAPQGAFPAYMEVMTAFTFVFLSSSLLLSGMPASWRFHPSEYLASAAFLAAMLPFTGHLYGIDGELFYRGVPISINPLTAFTLMTAAAGILFLGSDRGWARLLTAGGAAGFMMRLLLPLTLLTLLALAWVRLLGEQSGLYTSAFGVSLFVVVRVAIMGAIIIGSAWIVHRLERIRSAARRELEQANATLEQHVAERTAEIEAARSELKKQHDFLSKIMDSSGAPILLIDRRGKIMEFNRACEQITGYAADEARRLIFWDAFLSREHGLNPSERFRSLFEMGTPIEEETLWYTKAGSVRWVHWHGTALETLQGQINHCIIAGVDVTERRRAEDRVRQEEEQFEFIMTHLPVGVILSRGLEQVMLYQNPRFVEMFGYTIRDFPDVSAWWPLAYPDPSYRDKVAAQWNSRVAEASLLQTNITPMEVSITARDGSIKQVNVHAAVFGDLNVITFVDLTERQQAEKARHLNEMRLEALLKLGQMTKASTKELTDFALEEAVRLTDSTIGYFAFMNEDESVLSMYAWSRTAMQECAIQDKPILYPVKDTGLWGEAVRQRAPVITNDYEAPNQQKKGYPEGHVRIRRHMNIPVFDEGRIVIVAGVGNKKTPYDEADVRQLTLLMEGMWRILKRREDENTLKRMRSYLQNIVDSMPSVLVAVNLDGTVTHWNLEAAHLTGLTEEQTRGRDLGDVLPLLKDRLDRVRRAIQEGKTVENERFMVRDGEESVQYYDLRVFPLVANGAQGAVVRLDDVTSRVQIEDMMVQTEKMMSVGGLAAGMAHEINNPLGGILQACQNIERRTSQNLPKNVETAQTLGVDLELVRRYLQERGILDFVSGIRSDGMRAAQIVTDMLSFSRRSGSEFFPVNLPELVETVLRLAGNDYDLKKQYDFRNINIHRDFQADLPAVPCDKTKIEQVLLNLVKNAAQAMVGHNTTDPPAITISIRKEHHHMRIEISDNGPGMEEAVRRRVFEPFFTTKDVGVGTGLGLSVSYFIITRLHKGTLNVESTPGKGSKFIIQLPLQVEG
ncbi:MAG TPA: PAS domain S-box protein [Candidatus Hydrogenedentes bacterium]|nr:PAS domain S-box protein [Candidatus Hydrogenedentota bacterium]